MIRGATWFHHGHVEKKTTMPLPSARHLAAVIAVSAAAGAALPAPALAQTGGDQGELSISPCHVKQERNAQYSFAWCTVVSDAPAGVDTAVTVRSSMKPFKPNTGGSWSGQTRTLKFSGGGSQIWGVKYAFKGKTPAQVRKSLKVTLSNPRNATIDNATATVASG